MWCMLHCGLCILVTTPQWPMTAAFLPASPGTHHLSWASHGPQNPPNSPLLPVALPLVVFLRWKAAQAYHSADLASPEVLCNGFAWLLLALNVSDGFASETRQQRVSFLPITALISFSHLSKLKDEGPPLAWLTIKGLHLWELRIWAFPDRCAIILVLTLWLTCWQTATVKAGAVMRSFPPRMTWIFCGSSLSCLTQLLLNRAWSPLFHMAIAGWFSTCTPTSCPHWVSNAPPFDEFQPNRFPARLPAPFLAKDFGPAHVSGNETTSAAALWQYAEGQPQLSTYPHQSRRRLASTHAAPHCQHSSLVVVQTYHWGPPSPHHQLPHFLSCSAPLQPQITYTWSHPVGHLGHPGTSSVVELSFPAFAPTPAYAPSVDPDHQHFLAYIARLAADWSGATPFAQISLSPQQSMLAMHLSPLSQRAQLHLLLLHLVLNFPCFPLPVQDFPFSPYHPSCPTDNHWSPNWAKYVTNTTSLYHPGISSQNVIRKYWHRPPPLADTKWRRNTLITCVIFSKCCYPHLATIHGKTSTTNVTSSQILSNSNLFHYHWTKSWNISRDNTRHYLSRSRNAQHQLLTTPT